MSERIEPLPGCAGCRHFHQPEYLHSLGGSWLEFGECRRHAPKMERGDRVLPNRAWPMVRIDDWCGDREPRPCVESAVRPGHMVMK